MASQGGSNRQIETGETAAIRRPAMVRTGVYGSLRFHGRRHCESSRRAKRRSDSHGSKSLNVRETVRARSWDGDPCRHLSWDVPSADGHRLNAQMWTGGVARFVTEKEERHE